MAAGSSRPVAIARSIEHQVSRAPTATIGSERSPLLNGSQNARKTRPPVHSAIRLLRTARPSRGTTSRLMTSQHRIPASSAGSRIHGLAVETFANTSRTS